MTQGFNNMSAYQQMLMDTSPKTAEYYGDKIARLFTGGKDYMPKTVVKTGSTINPNSFNPIKGTGGITGAGLMLLPAWYGKDKYGAVGPGRATLDMSIIPLVKGILSTKEQRDKARQEYIDKYKPEWMGSVSKPSGDNSDSATSSSSKGTGGMGSKSTTQAQAATLAQQLGANPPVANKQDADTQQANIDAINDYVSKLQEINKPYIDALQDYYKNYNNYLNDYHRARDFYTGLAGWSGNSQWADVGKDYNAVANEAQKLATLKTLQDAQAGDVNAINEVMGNLAMAQEMGLPPEAAFANKNLLTMMAARDREANKYQIAVENNLMKKYGIDRNYARALAVQAMRGQNALDVASMYTNAYGNGGVVAPGLNRQGGVQTPYQPLANKPQSQEAALFQQVTGH